VTEELLVKALKRALEDEVEEGLEEVLMDDEGLENQGISVDSIVFEHAGLLDRSRLSGVKVLVVAFIVPLVGVRAWQDRN